MAVNTLQPRPFGKIRNLIWPIHAHELKRLLPMFAMFFLIAFAYNLLHCLKIPLIVKAPGSGAEVIPFLQIVAILPIAVLLTFIYTKLINRFSREHVFYIVIAGFFTYFALFTFILYPQRELLQLDTIADFLQNNVLIGNGSKGLIAAIRHLNLTLFYVLAEMWSVLVLFMLFWGFANEVTKVEEAKRFYAIFALGANCSGIISGEFARLLQHVKFIPIMSAYQGNEWLFLQLCCVLILSIGIVILFWWLSNHIFKHEKIISQAQPKSEPISISECLGYLKSSRYLLYMVLIVVGYYIVYNLSDILWAYKIELVMQTSKEINAYMSRVYSITGILAVILALLVSGNILRRYGWTIAALVTPVVWLLTSIGFFSGIALEGTMWFEAIGTLITNPANIVLLIGSTQICLGRGCKYTVFDESKEIAFIPLSKEEQRKCKVIIDGLASRFGKSGASITYVVLFYLCGEMANVVPYVAIIMFVALCAWIYATIKMGEMIKQSTKSGGTLTLITPKTTKIAKPLPNASVG